MPLIVLPEGNVCGGKNEKNDRFLTFLRAFPLFIREWAYDVFLVMNSLWLFPLVFIMGVFSAIKQENSPDRRRIEKA